MDLNQLMNDDSAPTRPLNQHRTSQQRSSFPPPLQQQRSSSGPHMPGPHHHQQQPQPQPPPPPPSQTYYQQRAAYPHDGRMSQSSLPSTPMARPASQQYNSGAYPFPSQAQQQQQQQQQQHHHQQQQQQQQQQHSPSQHYPQHTPRQPSQTHYPHAMSPTPPGPHRSPHVYPPPHSQPSTPLGPPVMPYSRQSSAIHAPHHRSASYALQHQVSLPAQSPAHSQPPQSAYPTESPQPYAKRPSIDYPTSLSERDRSLSVSPKTRVVLPTRQNSTDSTWAARERYASNEPRSTMMHRSSGDNAISPLTSTTKQPASARISPAQPRLASQPPAGLRSILNDDSSTHQSPLMVSSPVAARGHSNPPLPQYHPPHLQHSQSNSSPVQTFELRPTLKQEPHAPLSSESLLQQPISQPPMAPSLVQQASQPSLKRAAESEPERQTPSKKTKKRYAQPPIWGRYARSNPRYNPDVDRALGPPPDPTLARRLSPRPALHLATPQSQTQSSPQPQPPNPAQANGHAGPSTANGHNHSGAPMHPYLGPWEASIRGGLVQSDHFAIQVGKYLFEEMLSRPDVGVGDARNGALEIEAKLGTLIDRKTDQRVHLPVMHPVVLERGMSANLRFESHMTEPQHKCLNDFLNKAVQESVTTPGRHRLDYKHRYEIDSFAQLNQAGLDALPAAALNYMDQARVRNTRLRTTVNERAPAGADAVLARILKIRLADLDIFCPGSPFDCRISINIEVDMHNRADIDPTLIVEAGEAKTGGERKKDRLSYRHLAYSVDLTQVKSADGRKIHELEIEVDAIKLREQAERERAGQPNGFGDMVQGLINNVFTLMKVRLG